MDVLTFWLVLAAALWLVGAPLAGLLPAATPAEGAAPERSLEEQALAEDLRTGKLSQAAYEAARDKRC